MKYFKKGVLKYFKIYMNFFKRFQSEIFHRASLRGSKTIFLLRAYCGPLEQRVPARHQLQYRQLF